MHLDIYIYIYAYICICVYMDRILRDSQALEAWPEALRTLDHKMLGLLLHKPRCFLAPQTHCHLQKTLCYS